jgi:hypothetical protein
MTFTHLVESSWNVMAHGDARKGSEEETGEWSSQYPSHYLGTWCIQHYYRWYAMSVVDWTDCLPCRFKWTRPFRRKTKSGFCAHAITFQRQSTSDCTQMTLHSVGIRLLSKSRTEFSDYCDSWIAREQPLPVVRRPICCQEILIFGGGRRSPI